MVKRGPAASGLFHVGVAPFSISRSQRRALRGGSVQPAAQADSRRQAAARGLASSLGSRMHRLRSSILVLAIAASAAAAAAELPSASASSPSADPRAESVRKLQAELAAINRRSADAKTEEARQEIARDLKVLAKKINDAGLQASPRTRYAAPGKVAPEVEGYGQEVLLKIESLGTANFPKKNGKPIYGKPTLTFAITSSGAIEYVDVLRSSGSKEMDFHAVGVVKMAAPFAPFAKDLARDVDRIVFTFPFNYANENKQ